jgi:hypothetical protein
MPERVLSNLNEIAPIEVPFELQPQTYLKQSGTALYSSEKEVEAGGANGLIPDEYFGRGWDGHYLIGFDDREDPRTFHLRRRIRNRSLILSLALATSEQSSGYEIMTINRYLSAICKFTSRAAGRGVDVEVVEQMGKGRYAFFAPDGQGIYFEESLVEESGIERRLNRMLGTLGIEIAEGFAGRLKE